MRRLRFFRILLPALLVPFLVLVVLEIKRRPKPWSPPVGESSGGARAEGIRLTEIQGSDEDTGFSFRIRAGQYSENEKERWRSFEGVERLEIGRKDGLPLIVKADRADVDGKEPRRKLVVEGGIEIQDEDAGLWVYLPGLEAEEATGLARSVGEVLFKAPGYEGLAERLVYGLRGQPTEFIDLRIEGDSGWEMRALRARLLDGTDEIELSGGVTLKNGGDRISAVNMLLQRAEGGGLKSVVAEGEVSGTAIPAGRPPYTFKSDRAEMHWDDSGEKARLLLRGNAVVHVGSHGLAASRIEAQRLTDDAGGWTMTASGGVFARGLMQGRPSELHTQELEISINDENAVTAGSARGGVRFRDGATSTEAASAMLTPGPTGLRVVLLAEGDRRARLASEQRRVVADRIVTGVRGGSMRASGSVEATLLPGGSDANDTGRDGMFRLDQAVHFVARSLESLGDGERLEFTGAVRAWQGERNLSADRVVLRAGDSGLEAEGSVTTRIPRVASDAVSQAEYIQIASSRLDYTGENRRALFTGEVRARQAEGWLESGILEVDLGAGGGGIEMLRARDDVRLEYRAPSEEGFSRPIQGTADRLEYTPSDALVRLFGDESPATVTRSGEGGVKSEGRVLRYQLDTGRIEVESGTTDRGTIRTSGS